MARSEDFGQGRGRTRRPYDDQDLADRRAQPQLASDPPTQGRRAGTSYAPQFDRYVTQPAAEPVRASAPQPGSGRADPRQAQASYGGYAPEPQATSWDDQGFAQDQSEQAWAQPAARPAFGTRQRSAAPQQETYDQRPPQVAHGYDPQQGYGYDQGQAPSYGYPDQGGGNASQGHGYAQANAGGHAGYDDQAGYDQQGYDPAQVGYYPQGQQGYAQQPPGYGQHPQDYQQGYGDPNYQGDDQILANGEYVETEPSMLPPAPTRSRRGLIVAGAFVAAVLIGGGLGFVYKMTSESSFAANGEPPLLTADGEPTKSVPEEIASGDDGNSKSIYDRLNGEGEVQEASALGEGSEVVDVAKTNATDAIVVPTEPIGMSFPEETSAEGGSASSEDSAGTVEVASAEGEVVPKIRKVQVINVAPGELIDADAATTADVANDGTAAEDATASVPAPEDAGPALDGAALKEKPKKKKKATEEQVATLADADQAQAAEPKAETAKATGSGYVVQAAVANTSVEALSTFADMQQRFGSLLGDRQPDIQPIGGNKGFRLRIGPPASKQAASSLCQKLKSAGWKDCFIRSY